MPGKRIGFIDHRLDNFHAKVYLEALRGPLAHRGFVVAGATALLADPSRKWAEERGVRYFDSVEQLAPFADCFMVLAPSRPDLHLEMCRRVFPHSAPTFVDKKFAPDEDTARRIFSLADEYGTPIQTTSALRSTAVQPRVLELGSALLSLTVFASGTSFAEYGIHPVELAVSCFGPRAEEIMRLGPDRRPQWIIRFSDDRTAIIDFNAEQETPYSAVLSTHDGPEQIFVDGSQLFVDACASILDFFEAKTPLIDREESLAVHRILDHATDPSARAQFVSLRPLAHSSKDLTGPHWQGQSNLSKSRTAGAE
jgi:hypothetical protein